MPTYESQPALAVGQVWKSKSGTQYQEGSVVITRIVGGTVEANFTAPDGSTMQSSSNEWTIRRWSNLFSSPPIKPKRNLPAWF